MEPTLHHPSVTKWHARVQSSFLHAKEIANRLAFQHKIRGTINIVNNILRYPLTLKIHHQQQRHLSSCSRRLRTPFRLAQPRRRSYPKTDKSKQQGPSF
jgi:hypothetical protein